MRRELFDMHLRNLMVVEETTTPVLSVFMDRRDPLSRKTLERRLAEVIAASPRESRESIEAAWKRIETELDSPQNSKARSSAVFAREGDRPFIVSLEFEATLPTQMFSETTPVIFHLIELRDNYDRFVVLITRSDSACVLEVNLGSISKEVWTNRPELRRRVGREWTKRHYQNHRRDRAGRFIKEKISILDSIVRDNGHSHIILAGDPRLTAQVRKTLPAHLESRLVDSVPATGKDKIRDVVDATLTTFIAQEERESQEVAEMLHQEVRRSGLAAIGYEDSQRALEEGSADILVMSSQFKDDEVARREELIRLAESRQVHVEVVETSELLDRMGGVGCLLRFFPTSIAAAKSA